MAFLKSRAVTLGGHYLSSNHRPHPGTRKGQWADNTQCRHYLPSSNEAGGAKTSTVGGREGGMGRGGGGADRTGVCVCVCDKNRQNTAEEKVVCISLSRTYPKCSFLGGRGGETRESEKGTKRLYGVTEDQRKEDIRSSHLTTTV